MIGHRFGKPSSKVFYDPEQPRAVNGQWSVKAGAGGIDSKKDRTITLKSVKKAWLKSAVATDEKGIPSAEFNIQMARRQMEGGDKKLVKYLQGNVRDHRKRIADDVKQERADERGYKKEKNSLYRGNVFVGRAKRIPKLKGV